MFSNHVYKIIIMPTLVTRIPNLEIFLFCQRNSTSGGNLELRQTICSQKLCIRGNYIEIIHFSPETVVGLDLLVHGVCRDLHQFLSRRSPCISFSNSTHLLQMLAKYNKRYQNVNSKRLQLTTVYLLILRYF
jgi:hypothetical protein